MIRNVCFTLNNYTEPEAHGLLNNACFSYVIIGREVGKEGTPHLQGYGELTIKSRFATIKNKVGQRVHLEARKGTQEQAIAYCKKEGNWRERGDKRAMGARNDLDGIRQMAINDGIRAVTGVGSLQQIRVAEKFLETNEEPRDWKPFVYWFYGPTGAGKSRTARELCSEDTYCKNTGDRWWPGYDAHECVIIDDFRDSWWSLTEMLSLLDRYERRVEFKGGHRQFRPRLIIVTCLVHPRFCYRNVGEDVGQLLRRIDVVWAAC